MKRPTLAIGKSFMGQWGTPNTSGVSIPQELAFQNVCHAFGERRILDHISVTAKTGTVTCLLGPSGSGKTTLLRIAAGMEKQTSGQVLLDGAEIGGETQFLPPEKRGVGLVFQDFALFPHLSITDNVLFGLDRMQRHTRLAQAEKMLNRVGLGHRGRDFPNALSGGEQQRVALARALAPRPGVILMDEPFSGLDARLRDSMREETLAVLRETRATSIIVTHDPEEALRMGDQIVLLRHGRLEQAGTGRELYFKPRSLFVAGFFSELNTFDGICGDGYMDTPIGRLPFADGKAGDPAHAAFRVETIRVSTEKPEGDAAQGRILSSRFTGNYDNLNVGVSGCETPIRARMRAGRLSGAALSGQTPVWVSSEPEGRFVFPKTIDGNDVNPTG